MMFLIFYSKSFVSWECTSTERGILRIISIFDEGTLSAMDLITRSLLTNKHASFQNDFFETIIESNVKVIIRLSPPPLLSDIGGDCFRKSKKVQSLIDKMGAEIIQYPP